MKLSILIVQINAYLIIVFAGEEKMNRAIDDIRAVEAEKRENALAAERVTIYDLESNIRHLQQVGVH